MSRKWLQSIDRVFYINLLHRRDRRLHMERWLRKIGVPATKIERIPAVACNPGFRGCTQSHMKAVQTAYERKYEWVMILEDDLMLHVLPDEFHQHMQNVFDLSPLRDQLDALMLGMNPCRLDEVREGPASLVRVRQALGLPGLVIPRRYMPTMIQIFETALRENQPHDLITQRLQPTHRWYGFFPPIARQRPDFSDIEQAYRDYTALEVNGIQLVSEVGVNKIISDDSKISAT